MITGGGVLCETHSKLFELLSIDSKLTKHKGNMSVSDIRKTFVEEAPLAAPNVKLKAQPLSFEDLLKHMDQLFGAGMIVESQTEHAGDPFVVVAADRIVECLQKLSTDSKTALNVLRVVSAIDYPPVEGEEAEKVTLKNVIEVVYVLYSHVHRHQLIVKARLAREEAKIPSVTSLFRVANFQEREIYDMHGVVFAGHPNLKRVLLPDDWIGYPLRKDYVYPEEYNGMKVPL